MTTEYLYDGQENRIGWVKYDSSRQPVFQYFYPYDADHNKIVPPAGSENLQPQGEFIYDANGKLTAWMAYDSSGTEIVGEYEEMDETAYAVFQHCSIMELLP